MPDDSYDAVLSEDEDEDEDLDAGGATTREYSSPFPMNAVEPFRLSLKMRVSSSAALAAVLLLCRRLNTTSFSIPMPFTC